MIGQEVGGRYRVIEYLGRGSYGETWKAVDKNLPGYPYCVVKKLDPQSNQKYELNIAERLFIEEAETLQKLSKNEHIPQILAFFQEEYQYYLVMEYIEGEDLSLELNSGDRWDENQVIELLQQILHALEVIQKYKLIHRDIKPSNLMRRSQDGKIILIDFGCVKIFNPSQRTVFIGTPGYIPDEQIKGYPQLNSDIYAVGMIGIQALTGKLPSELTFNADHKIMWRNPEVKVSKDLAEILDKMVKYKYSERYSCATQALNALKEVKSRIEPTLLPCYPTTVLKPSLLPNQLLVAGLMSVLLTFSYLFLESQVTNQVEANGNHTCEFC
ncbi:MAG: serine/threonine protein kinase [Sphaerospermopsis sp. SIO1G2]|nr:serine/threonine protein kinase [Sphaerospermopsis sp. SIO1G2]